MHEVQRSRSHSRREHRNLLELVHQIASNHDLHSKRQMRHVATCERTHEAIERSVATPVIVSFACNTVETESDMRNRRTIFLDGRPDAIKVPAVSDEARGQPGIADGSKYVRERRMKRRLSAGEVNASDVCGRACFVDNAT